MAKTKKKEVQKQGLRPSQKAKAEKLRKKQEAKTVVKTVSKQTSDKVEEEIVDDTKVIVKTPKTTEKTSTPKKVTGKKIRVKNAEGDPDTDAEILIQNKIDYTPKVSVIIPVYNVEPFLHQTLDSVLSQTLKEIEVICVDDGSTDASLDILKEYAEKDNRITVITQKNLYAGVARNTGLSQAKGEYVHFLDSDDWIISNGLEIIADICFATNVDFVKFKNYTYDNQQKKYIQDPYTEIKYFSKDLFDKILTSDTISDSVKLPDSPWSGIYKLAFLNKNNIRFDNLKCANDSSFFFKCLSVVSTYYVSSQHVINYRVNNNKSLVGIRAKNFDCQLRQFHKINTYIASCNDAFKKNVRLHLIKLITILYDKYLLSDMDVSYKQKLFHETFDFFNNIPLPFLYNDEDLINFYEKIHRQINCKITVIIPVYNKQKYLAHCLDSIISQTLKEIEIVCVNDGSKDNSLEILKSYAQRDNRIVVINQSNKGVSYSRNKAISVASGEFIAFMDADDYYPNKESLELLYTNATKNNVSICGGGLLIDDGEKLLETSDDKQKYDKNQILSYKDYQYDYGFQRFIFSKELLIKNNIQFPLYTFFEDPVFFTKAMILADKFFCLKEDTYVYSFDGQKRVLSEEKVFHLLQGLRDNLIIAINANLSNLYELTLNRIKKEYKKNIAEVSSERVEDLKKEIMDICLQYAHKNCKSNKAKVSVILPIYNAEPFLRECLNSVVNQTLNEIEIICVNDGSTDNSFGIIKEYAAKDERIKFIDKPNAGYGQTMNSGIDLATGEYIGIVEPDDYIALEMYEVLYNKAKKDNLDIVKSDYYAFSKNKSEYISIVSKDSYNTSINRKKSRNLIGFSINPTGIFKKENIDKYHIRFNETPGASHQDIGFSFLTSFFSDNTQYIPQGFYYYRQDNENSSMRKFANPNIMLDEYDFIYTKLLQYPDIFGEVKDLFYQRRHNSFMYFGNNRISDYDKIYFWKKVQKIYEKDVEENFLQYLQPSQVTEAENILIMKPIIPIFCSTDDNYIPYLSVMLLSIKKHISEKYKYVVYVLYTDITDDNQKLLEKLSGDNLNIFFINVSNKINNQNLYTLEHFSKEMYYRLLIPELFSYYEKILYLDCDLLIQQDVAQLYECDVNKYILGAILNPPNRHISSYKQRLGLDEHSYFNSGVLVINVKEFNRENVKQKAFDFLRDSYECLRFPDQDLLNILCKNKVKFLDNKWNFQWSYLFDTSKLLRSHIDSYIEASKSPYIIHYTTKAKAWNTSHPMAEVWWNYAKESPFYTKITNINGFHGHTPLGYKILYYCAFPYNLLKLANIRKKYLIAIQHTILREISTLRIDVKNFGLLDNTVQIKASNVKIEQPDWFTDAQGKGKIIQSNELKQKITIKAIKDGNLCFTFRGINKSDANGVRFPIWIDYKSIKIDNKEILSEPIYVWHDRPFKYEILVKDGQEITLEVEQQRHQYTKEELKDLLIKLHPNDEYLINNINEVIQVLCNKLPIIDEKTKKERELKTYSQEIIPSLTSLRIDVKNFGLLDNTVQIKASNVKIEQPDWFTDAQGKGKIIQSNELKQKITIKAIKDGNLCFTFRGINKSDANGVRFPIWIDYKSIKIDNKEILSEPIYVWHDRPFKYEILVKDGQEITLEVEQQRHQYTKEELKDLLIKLHPNDEYLINNINEVIEKSFQTMGNGLIYTPVQIDKYPQIVADCFIPLGSACRPAYWIKKYNLRNCSLPFDWLGGYTLNFVLKSIKNGIDDWFNEYTVDPSKADYNCHYVYDTKNRFRSRHAFPLTKTVEEYMPEFNEIFGRRYERMKNILETSKNICFVCNRNDSIYEFSLFLINVLKMYPKLKVQLLNIRDSNSESKMIQYKIDENIMLYDIIASDINKNGADPSNPKFWIGNENLWNDICVNFVLSNGIKNDYIQGDNIIKIYAPENYIKIKKNYKLKDTLSYEIVENGICVPPVEEQWNEFYNKYLCTGCILDGKNKHVLVSAMGKQKIHTRSDNENDIRCKSIIHKKAIYLGCFISQYGHFISQGLSRLWFLLDNQYKDYDLIYTIKNNSELTDFMKKILSLFGIQTSKLVKITHPTQYDEIIVPEVSFALYNFWTEEYKKTIDKIKHSITPIENDKIYLSRCHYKDNIIGETSIEKIFRNNGYKIIYPEELSVDEQIAIISGANTIVTSTGTIAHNLVFAHDNARCAILERGNKPNITQPIINEMRNLDSSYIMANYAMLPVASGSGPYILGINQYMQRYLEENGIIYNKDVQNEYYQYQITYQYLWQKIYSNKNAYNDLKMENRNISEEYLLLILKQLKELFDGKDIQIISDKILREQSKDYSMRKSR